MLRSTILALVAIAIFSTASLAQTIELSGEIREGETVAHRISESLMFCLIPEAEYGFQVSVAATCERTAKNFAMIATPPYRGVNPIQLYSWHFLPGANILPDNRAFQFVSNDKDYKTIMEMLRHPHDAGKLLKLVAELGKGRGQFRILEFELAPGAAQEQPKLVRLRFTVKLTLP